MTPRARGGRSDAARCGAAWRCAVRSAWRGAWRRGRARRVAARRLALTLAALALVLASAALHAGWNALIADAHDTHATTAVALLVGAAVFALPAALRGGSTAEAWPYIAASAALELAYFALLAAVYCARGPDASRTRSRAARRR